MPLPHIPERKPSFRKVLLPAFYEAMSRRFSPCGWWPGETPFEVAVGAILTQNTSWRNVEAALDLLRAKDALKPEILLEMPDKELEAALRPSGFFRVKAKRLRHLLLFFALHAGWDRPPGNLALEFLQYKATAELRRELLAVSGVGAETADCILLYALNRPTFVVDAYTRRICCRHGLATPDISYEQLRSLFMDNLPLDVPLYNEYHALIVRTGNTYCKKNDPLCDQCPLGSFFDNAVE